MAIEVTFVVTVSVTAL